MKISELKLSEDRTHLSVCLYVQMAYPSVIFNTDLSGLKMTKGQALKASKMRSSSKFPDLVFYEPRGEYHGLFIELKRPHEKIYKRDGSLRKSDHLQGQEDMHEKLRKRGYKCTFAVGYAEAKMIIDKYLKYGQ